MLTQVTSQTKHLPLLKGIIVAPSGRLIIIIIILWRLTLAKYKTVPKKHKMVISKKEKKKGSIKKEVKYKTLH